MKNLKVAIIEDNQITRDGLKLLLSSESNIEVVATYEDAESALSSLSRRQGEQDFPTIIICDLGLPQLSGIDAIKSMQSQYPSINIMAYTVFEDANTIFKALKAGASSYMLKGTRASDLIEALWELNSGGSPMSPYVARLVVKAFQDNHHSENLLTDKEKQVLLTIESGSSYKEVAHELNISLNTVKTHIKNIYRKLQAQSKTEALVNARRQGALL